MRARPGLFDWVRGQHLHVCEIDDCELVIFLARNQSQSSADIEGDPVRALDSRDWMMPDNLGSNRIPHSSGLQVATVYCFDAMAESSGQTAQLWCSFMLSLSDLSEASEL
jgi:hypothetical protein